MEAYIKKIKDVIHLIVSKSYIIITNKQTIFAGHFSDLEKFSAVHYMKLVQKNLKDMIARLEKEIK